MTAPQLLQGNEPFPWHLRLWGIGRAGVERICQALQLLQQHAVEEYVAIVWKLEGVAFNETFCGPNAIACIDHRRVAVLVGDPAFRDPLDLAIDLRHEADHINLHANGAVTMNQHTCRDCRAPWERAQDAIYQRDEHVRALIQRQQYRRW